MFEMCDRQDAILTFRRLRLDSQQRADSSWSVSAGTPDQKILTESLSNPAERRS
jgi:hypothetical protein